jgi:hypothetical protein
MKKLTKSIRKSITLDWLSYFPFLGEYKPMQIIRVVGPLAVGLCLNEDSTQSKYLPTFFIHFLFKPFPVISLAVNEVLRTDFRGVPEKISVDNHAEAIKNSAIRMEKLIPFDFSAEIKVEDMANYLWGYSRTAPVVNIPPVLEGLLLLSHWSNNKILIEDYTNKIKQRVSEMPDSVKDAIYSSSLGLALDGSHEINFQELRATVLAQMEYHKLSSLPYCKLLA